LSAFDYVEINGMETVDPAKVYSILCQKLLDKKVTGPQAATLLEKHFTSPSKKKRMCLLLVDELDQFMTKTQKILYNFFDWPNRPGSNLVAIAIANTMDLPERAMLNRISSRIGLSRINFEPYTHQQLNDIIRFRLDGLDIFEDNALEMCSRKVSAISGDARRALDICR
jgi:origin recognition complex subunit 1